MNNDPTNLVTACRRCNTVRGDRPAVEFAKDVAVYLGHLVTPGDVLDHIDRCRDAALDLPEAKRLIALRGSAHKAIWHAPVK